MSAATSTQDRTTIRVHRVTSYPGLMGLDLNKEPVLKDLPIPDMAASGNCVSNIDQGDKNEK